MHLKFEYISSVFDMFDPFRSFLEANLTHQIVPKVSPAWHVYDILSLVSFKCHW